MVRSGQAVLDRGQPVLDADKIDTAFDRSNSAVEAGHIPLAQIEHHLLQAREILFEWFEARQGRHRTSQGSNIDDCAVQFCVDTRQVDTSIKRCQKRADLIHTLLDRGNRIVKLEQLLIEMGERTMIAGIGGRAWQDFVEFFTHWPHESLGPCHLFFDRLQPFFEALGLARALRRLRRERLQVLLHRL